MTRSFTQQFHCPNCRTFQTQETLFGRWLRNNPALDSQAGYAVSDQDYWVHRYRTNGTREAQCLMLVEVKTFGRQLSVSQSDTLWIIDQVMRNRVQTPTTKHRLQSGRGPLRAKSKVVGKDVEIKVFGVHVLTFSGLGPDDSDVILWDGKQIDLRTLTQLLRFDLDPDTLRVLDLRSHHAKAENMPLPFVVSA